VIAPRAAATAAAVAVLALCAACTSSSSSGGEPADGSSSAAAQLTDLAGRGAAATYSAAYQFHQVTPNTTADVNVWHAPPNLRVDIAGGGATASFIRTAAATYSCASKKHKLSCFTVAGPGQPAPAPFDVGPATLFSDDLTTLSVSGVSYVVTVASSVPAGGGLPAATCFALKAGLLTPAPAVQPGTYCFADTGVLTSVTYPSGNTAKLTQVSSDAPAFRFKPYAKPAPLPS
jgi:hypothetical protein